MGLLKAAFFGVLAAIGIATAANDIVGLLGDAARWHSVHLPTGSVHLYFSIPIFLGVTLFAWAMMIWSRG